MTLTPTSRVGMETTLTTLPRELTCPGTLFQDQQQSMPPFGLVRESDAGSLQSTETREGNPNKTDGVRHPFHHEEHVLADEGRGSEHGLSTKDPIGRNGDVGEIHFWDGQQYFSDLVNDGLKYLHNQTYNDSVIMVFEAPTSSTEGTSFFNSNKYRLHDYPPTPVPYMTFLRPLRYASMNGNRYPAYLMGPAPSALLQHWQEAIPDFVSPNIVNSIPAQATVNAYFPIESVTNKHVNDPDIHYWIAGKDAISHITNKTTRIFANTKEVRPCVAKVTHAMGSLGIFVIHDDADEKEFLDFVQTTGNPTYVITEYVHIQRSLACHFFLHPNGDVVWFGSTENLPVGDGKWSLDSTIDMEQQGELQVLMRPFVEDVARSCYSKGFWGFVGIDVLVDNNGVGFLVDLNPRVTGTMPAMMVGTLVKQTYGYTIGKFRKSSNYAYHGSAEELFAQVNAHNEEQNGKSRVVIFSIYPKADNVTMANIGTYSNSHEESERVMSLFSSSI